MTASSQRKSIGYKENFNYEAYTKAELSGAKFSLVLLTVIHLKDRQTHTQHKPRRLLFEIKYISCLLLSSGLTLTTGLFIAQERKKLHWRQES